MAIKNFPEDLYVQTVDTASEAYVGSIVPSESIELKHINLGVFKHGAQAGTEQFQLKIYEDSLRETVLYTSDTLDLADAENLTSSDWKGTLRFDFNRQNLVAGSEYYVTINPVTYTRNGNTFYFSTTLDWPFSVNTQQGSQAGSIMEIWGYK